MHTLQSISSTATVAYSPKSFLTRFSTESLLGSVSREQGNQVSTRCAAMECEHAEGPADEMRRLTVRVVLARNLEQGRESTLVLLDQRPDLVRDLYADSRSRSDGDGRLRRRTADGGREWVGDSNNVSAHAWTRACVVISRTCWLMRTIAMSGLSVNSSKAASIVAWLVSALGHGSARGHWTGPVCQD